MPITEYIKRRFLPEITSAIHTRVIGKLKEKASESDEDWIVKSKYLPSILKIEVVPYYEDYQQVRLIIKTRSKTNVELQNAVITENKEIYAKHQLEYLLDFRNEVKLVFISIGAQQVIKFDKEKQLAPDLLPYLYKEQYEQTAERFLKAFYPEVSCKTMPIDPQVALDKLGLQSKAECLSHDGSILGKTNFKMGLTKVYDNKYKRYKEMTVAEDTVLYDSSGRHKHSKNITVIHEAYHHFDHKPHIIIKEFLRNQKDYISFEDDFKDSIKWLEHQAKVIPPRILMPELVFQEMTMYFLQKQAESTKYTGFLEMLRRVIEQLADYFQVSKQAARIRLIELGYTEARGIFDYVDGRYVADYGFGKNRLKLNETLTISKAQLAQLYLSNAEFRELLDSGKYVYVDSHVVLNHPDIVWTILDNYKWLTEKALFSLERYALIFTIRKTSDQFLDDESVLYRLYSSSYSFETTFNKGIQLATPDRQNEVLMEQLEREAELRRQLPSDFVECMKMVKKWQDCTYAEIAEAIDCDQKKVERLFRDESGNFQLFILVMVYLQLPTDIVKKIYEESRYRVDTRNPDHLIYNLVMNTFQGKSVDYTKKFFLENNISLTY